MKNEEQIHGIYSAYQLQHNRTPRTSEVVKYAKCSAKEAIDFHKKFIAEGHIKKNKNKTEYYKRAKKKIAIFKNTEPKEEGEEQEKEGLDPRAFSFMRWSMLASGVGAVVMSIYHSQYYLQKDYILPLAIFAACVFVFFEVTGFDIAVFMLKKKRFLTGTSLVFVALVAMAFSINSTVGGMYANSADKLNTTLQDVKTFEKEEEKESREWESIQEQKESVTLSLLDIREVVKNYTEELKYLVPGTQLHNVTAWRLTQAENKRDEYRKDLKEVQDRETAYLDREGEEKTEVIVYKKSYYEWIGGAVFKKVRPELFEFIMSIFPAVFYDVLAPLAIGVFMFTGKPKGKKD